MERARSPAAASGRIALIDLLRTLALLCMASFHFTVDLEIFGFVPRGTTLQGFWWFYARGIAGSFIFLAGVSLWLAHGRGIRWAGFARRQAMIAAAALAVTLATFVAMRPVFVYYGILHSIFVSSLVGLLVLRLPAAVTLLLAAASAALPYLWSSPALDHPLLWWTGLADRWRPAMDFEPFFPWVAPMLAGIAAGCMGDRFGLWARLRGRGGSLTRRLGWPGRHSLAVYLIHQPVLLALVGGVAWVTGRI